MAGIRIVEGLDPEDRIALGLPAANLVVAATGAVLALTTWSAPWPQPVRVGLCGLLAVATAGLAWGRAGERSALAWTGLWLGYQRRRHAAGRPSGQAFGPPPATPRGPGVPPQRAAPRRLPLPPPPGAGARGGAGPAREGARPRRVAFCSLKGGVGRTTLATEVAALLAAKGRVLDRTGVHRPLRVVLCDLDLDGASVGCRTGLTGPTLGPLLELAAVPPAQLRRTLQPEPSSGMRVLLGPSQGPGPAAPVPPQRVTALLDALDPVDVDLVLLDLGSGLGPIPRAVVAAADELVVVLTPNPAAIQDTYRTVAGLRRCGLRRPPLFAVNRDPGTAPLDALSSDLGGRLAASIAFDPGLEAAEWRHTPYALAGRGPAVAGLRRLAAALHPSAEVPWGLDADDWGETAPPGEAAIGAGAALRWMAPPGP